MSSHVEQGGAGRRTEQDADLERVQAEILRAIREVRFGSVEIIIHDAKVVQIERREKTRFTN